MENLKRVILYNPAISSINLGDHIIAAGAKEHLRPVIDGAFQVEISTHLPPSLYMRIFRNADYRFVLGSNLLRGRMNGIFRQWDIHMGTAHWVSPAILVGAGWWQYGDEPNRYTRLLYRRVLSKKHVHSVRDSYTKEMLRRCGVHNVVVTGCPTLWNLGVDQCARIPSAKAGRVVFTLTDYHEDRAADQLLIRALLDNYDEVLFWPQGYGDTKYLDSVISESDASRVQLLGPSLAAFDEALDDGDVDYIGTRLHGGIRALQRTRRALIIAIDNRAEEMNRDFDLPIVRRGEETELVDWIHGERATEIQLPEEQIAEWKAQFA